MRGLRFTVCGSRFAVHGSRFTVRGSHYCRARQQRSGSGSGDHVDSEVVGRRLTDGAEARFGTRPMNGPSKERKRGRENEVEEEDADEGSQGENQPHNARTQCTLTDGNCRRDEDAM
jgi:hypothetical protein